MLIDTTSAWSVRLTHPKGSPDGKGGMYGWPHNENVTVVAPTIEAALALVREQWPNVTVWSANHIGGRPVLLADVEKSG